jgi:FkbM family methyltransferase
MAELRPGDRFVDVGAFIGLYAIAAGLRLRNSGQVIAFEPDGKNFRCFGRTLS